MFTGIVVNGVELEGLPGTEFTLKQFSTLFDTDDPKGEYSMPISFSLTDKNVRALKLFNRINYADDLEKYDCELYGNGVFLRKATLVINEMSDKLSGYLLMGMSSLAAEMRNQYIDELDYGPIIEPGDTEAEMVAHMLDTINNPDDHNYIFTTVESKGLRDNFVNQSTFYSEPAANLMFDGVFEQNTERRVNDTPHIPFLKLNFVINKIMDALGFTLDWPLMQDETFKKLILVNNRCLLEDAYLKDIRVKSDTVHRNETLQTPEYNVFNAVMNPTQHTVDDLVHVIAPGGSERYMPATVVDYVNILADIDTPTPYINEYNQWEIANGRCLVKASGKIDVHLECELNLVNPATAPSPTGVMGSYIASIQMFMFEVSINGRRLAYDIVYADFDSVAPANWYDAFEYTFNLYNVDIPAADIGYYIDFKIGCYFEIVDEENNDYRSLGATVFESKITDLKIKQSNLNVFQKFSYDIDYGKHLEHVTISEFLSSIRGRFGAYVKHINFEDRIITYGALGQVHLGEAKERFALRNEFFTKTSVRNSHKWKYKFDVGEEKHWIPFYNKTIGDENADIEHNEYEYNMGPVFYITHSQYGRIASKTMKGISRYTSNTEVTNYLAIYHGLRDRGDGFDYPTAASNNILNGVTVCPWGLRWNGSDGLYAMFLEGFWQYFIKYMEVEFTLHPDMIEILQYQNDNIDFYNYMRFLVKQIDFRIGENAITPTVAKMVKLDM